jgi:molybdopterin molybdotransferase
MIPVEEALDRILSRVVPLGHEHVEIVSCLGRVLAEEVRGVDDVPPWPNSYVAGRVAAGAPVARPLEAGEAYRIFTGAPMPEGADAVVPQEDVRQEATAMLLERPVESGAYVRPRGEDLAAGDVVLRPGRVVGAADVGLLATVGRTRATVVRRPSVGILSTGDEIADLGRPIEPGQIRNSNTYSLMAQVTEAGAEPLNLGVARDALADIEARLRWGLGCDLVLSSAGVSVGEHDFVKAALTNLGAEQHLWLVDMRPGKPIAFATIPQAEGRAVPVFALPGNPVSAMVTFELFVRPALLKMAGHAVLDRRRVRATALAPIANPGRRRGYLRVTLTSMEDGYGARLTGEQGSGILRSMVAAHGLAVVPGDTTIPTGKPVTVIVLREPSDTAPRG